jgi:5'-3' exonuclease
MGVRHLNKFLMENCPRSMQYITFEQLRGKTIVVDISIYLYKFKAVDQLIQLITRMFTDFVKYGIKGVFIFDGKPKLNKQIELQLRKDEKEKSWQKYKYLLDNNITTDQLAILKQQCTKVSLTDINNVKTIMDKMGMQYIVAPFEADEICAKLMTDDKVYACMSDDTDMLVYGCKRVLRKVNFDTKTAIIYKLDEILKYLRISYDDFKRLCVIAGTDYSKTNKQIFMYMYNKYRLSGHTNLYDWLKNNHMYANYENLESICQDFDITHSKYEYLNDIVKSLNM